MKTITKKNILKLTPNSGKHCFMYPASEGKAYKIFDAYPLRNLENLDEQLRGFRWGDLPAKHEHNMSVLLTEATKIQNYMWAEGLAPRVYDIKIVKFGVNYYFAQLVEDLGEGTTEITKAIEVYNKVKELGKKYGFENDKDDVSEYDVINGKLIDFNTFHFTKDHEDKIKQLYIDRSRYGKIYYHKVPEFGLSSGPRDNEARIRDMEFDKLDFKGKSVLDLGTAGGWFTRWVKDQGALRVTGVDSPGFGSDDPIGGARLIANELEYWDIDYKEKDLADGNWHEEYDYDIQADITLFFSMNYHIDIPDWLPKVTKELCIVEDNSKERNADIKLKTLFKRVEEIGKGTVDHDPSKPKRIFFCYK